MDQKPQKKDIYRHIHLKDMIILLSIYSQEKSHKSYFQNFLLDSFLP